MNKPDKHAPVLITEAAPSRDDEQASRIRKYTVMMAMRLPCLILAGVFYHTWWLALGLILLSIPLPWIAVLIANDRPARKAERVNRYTRDVQLLEIREHRVIDSTESADSFGGDSEAADPLAEDARADDPVAEDSRAADPRVGHRAG